MNPYDSNPWLKRLSGIQTALIEDHYCVYLPFTDFTTFSWRHVGTNDNIRSWILRSVEFELMDYDAMDEDIHGLGGWINGEARMDITDVGADEQSALESNMVAETTTYKFQHEITSMVVLARVCKDNSVQKTIVLEPIQEHGSLRHDFERCIHVICEVMMLAAKRDFTLTGVVSNGKLIIQSDAVRCEVGAVVELSFTIIHTVLATHSEDVFRALFDSVRIVRPLTPEEAYTYVHYY
ncbi:hypothetical protein V5O48_010344 [Marasmius crinis-equi]|uniref:Uncharacterized protein n=1 Tax=Marasmius crinis-equi TaxID=585013 RepID=A0ABR3F8L5_9AGAR